MPSLLRVCSAPGCTALVERGRCAQCQQQKQKAYDLRRGSASSRGYGSDWERWRESIIATYKLRFCGNRPPHAPQTADSRCEAEGRIVAGSVLDHIEPIDSKDDPRRFDVANVQRLCGACHDAKRQRESRTHQRIA